MLNLLTKTKPWMVASLLVATSVFAQDNARSCPPKDCKPCAKPCPAPCPQPNPPTQMCPPTQSACCPPWPVPVLNAAYNYPARTMTRCPWDVYFDASFIFWQPLQDNLELGVNVPTAVVAGAVTTTTATLINMETDYKPGFKVGMGGNFDYDNWDLHAEYTWFHNTNSTSASIVAGTGAILTTQGSPLAPQTTATAVSQSWRLKMDIAELALGRSYYVGTKLTFRPSFGARGAWIRQKLTTDYTITTTTDLNSKKSTSWAVGPQVGLDANWVLGEGFRFYGNAEGDLLYTRYNRLSASHTSAAGTTVNNVQQSKYGTVRTHLDLELGFGWGTYIDCNNWYMDFTAGYGFQVFFDQNMFRDFTASGTYNSFSPNGNLYVQGLTVTARLDF